MMVGNLFLRERWVSKFATKYWVLDDLGLLYPIKVNTDIEWPVESFTSNVDVPGRSSKKPRNDVICSNKFVSLGKTKLHSCLGFLESTNAQWF